MIRAYNERAASRSATANRRQLEEALNQYTESMRATIIWERQQNEIIRQSHANSQKIVQMRKELADLGDEANSGANAKAARASILEGIEDLNRQNQELERTARSARERLDGILQNRAEARSELTKRESSIWYFRDEEPFKNYDKNLGRLHVLFSRQAELKSLEEKASAKLKNPAYESAELAAIRRELKENGEKLETNRKSLVSARQDFEHMLSMRSGAGRYFLALVPGVAVAAINSYVQIRHCQNENALLQSDADLKIYFSLDDSCRLRSNPQQLENLSELGTDQRNALFNKPKFCSAVRKYLTDLRQDQKFAQLDVENSTCDFPRMINYEADGHRFINKIEKLDNGNYRMTGSFVPGVPPSDDTKDPAMFQLLIQQEKDGNLLPGTFRTRNPNWTSADLMQWSELATRKTILESAGNAGYPRPEERADMARPVMNLMPRLQQSADRQWRAIQETAMTVAVGCASGLIGKSEGVAPTPIKQSTESGK